MYKRSKRKKLGRKKTHRESLIRNLLRSLFDNNYVVTTTAKAKVLKQSASSLIEEGKNKGDDKAFSMKLEEILGKGDLVEKYKDYLKKEDIGAGFVRVCFRAGDNAEMSRVFLLGLDKKAKAKKSTKEDEKGKKKEKKEEPKKKTPLDIKEEKPIGLKKKVDKTAVIKKTERRPRTRAAL